MAFRTANRSIFFGDRECDGDCPLRSKWLGARHRSAKSSTYVYNHNNTDTRYGFDESGTGPSSIRLPYTDNRWLIRGYRIEWIYSVRQ
jgi:hypothetical protein